MTNDYESIKHADVALVIGSNTTENHPVIGSWLKEQQKKGRTKLIVCDPRSIELNDYADIKVRHRSGSDVALLNGLMNIIIAEGLHDKEFIDKNVEKFDELKALVAEYTPAKVSAITGVPEDTLKEAARLYARGPNSAIFYTMGITQHQYGTNNVKTVADLALLCGMLGRPGTGVNPLRGQNNVQGACDMACLPGNLPAYKKVTEAADRKPFEDVWGVSLPDKVGFTIPKIIDAAASGAVKALYVMGENPMMSDPDVKHVEKALKNLDLLVVQDIFLTETGNLAHVVLPTAGWSEKEGTYTNTERRVQRIRKAVDAPGEARPDWEIITLLANRLGANWKYASAKDIFEEVRKVTVSYAGITYDRIEKEGIQWPCPNTEHPGTQILHSAAFTRGKGLFSVCEHIDPAELPDNEYPLLLTTGRILYQYHTATMSRRSKGLVSRTPQPFVEIHPDDAAKLGIAHGDKIEVSSRRGSIEVFAEVNGRCDKGVVFIPFHYSEAAVNRLTHTAIDPVANIPEYKVSAVKIRKVA